MKPNNTWHLISAVLLIFILSLTLPSCAVFGGKKLDTQKRGLMLQDKADFGTNKGKFKGSKGHKSQKKRARQNKKFKRRH